MMGTYYGKRPIVREKTVEEPVLGADGQQLIDPVTGKPAFTKVSRRVVEEFDFAIFKHLWLNVSVDVGATTYYSEIAMVQTLDNLRRDGTLSIIEYLERMPDKLITRKQELIESLKKRMGTSLPSPGGQRCGATGVNDLPVAGQSRGVTEPQREGGSPSGLTDEVTPAAAASLNGGEEGAYVIGSELDAAKKIAQLPTSMQARYNDLPKTAQRALIK